MSVSLYLVEVSDDNLPIPHPATTNTPKGGKMIVMRMMRTAETTPIFVIFAVGFGDGSAGASKFEMENNQIPGGRVPLAMISLIVWGCVWVSCPSYL